jgi:hypothetical protein
MGLLNVQKATSRDVSTYWTGGRFFPSSTWPGRVKTSFRCDTAGHSIRRCYNGGPLNPPA